MRHQFLLMIPIAIASLIGCTTSPAVSVDMGKVTATVVQDGKVVVTGQPGAVHGDVYSVTLTIRREGGYTAQHFDGAGMSIISGYAVVAKDGSFPATTLGDPVDYVKSGDELNVQTYVRGDNNGTGIQLQQVGSDAFVTLK